MNIPNILQTTDYGIFKKLVGNRPVRENHVQQIVESIRKNGLKKHPIKCNSKMEVVDGQHRLRACEITNQPVYYFIDESADFEDCITMNSSQVSWDTVDYIYAFSDRGNKHYQMLKELYELYPELSISTILAIVSRKATGVAKTKKSSQNIKTGVFTFPFNLSDEIAEEFDYLKSFAFVRKKNSHGRADIFYNAIAACYECPFINNDRLLERLSTYTEKLAPYNSFRECLEAIQVVYNMHARNKTYLAHEVQQMLDKQKKEAKEEEIA